MLNKTIVEKINQYPIHWALGGDAQDGGLCQNVYELLSFCKFIIDQNIQSYTEIGIENGLLLKFMTQDIGLVGYGIDITKKITHNGLNVIYGCSHDADIIKIAPYTDLYFIDANHSYESVTKDFYNYKNKCKWMAFHDILGLRNCEGVSIFWDEIKHNFNFWEFIDDNQNIASGIGLIKL